MYKIFTFAAACLLTVSAANAAIVDATLAETGEGTGVWDLMVSITPEGDDTSGLAGYALNLSGLADSAGYEWTESTLTTFSSGFQNVGFTSVLSAGPVGSTGFSAAHSQGAVDNPIPGIGIDPVFVEGFATGGFPNIELGVPAVLGQLSGAVGLTENEVQVDLTLLPTAGGNPFRGTINLSVVPGGAEIPEPATMGLAGLAIAGALGFRRRR